MRIKNPKEEIRQYLNEFGLQSLNDFEIDDAELVQAYDEVSKQHPEENQTQHKARAIARVAWLHSNKKAVPAKVAETVGDVAEAIIPRKWRKWVIAWGIAVLILLGVIAVRAQVDCVRLQDEGVTVKQFCGGIAVANFTGGGITCSFAAGKVTCNVPTGGGGASWDAITNPLANQSIAMGAFTSTWTFGAATGAGINLITVTDTLNNTGTGYIWNVNLASGSAAKPARLAVNGNGVEVNNSGLLTKLGTGGLDAAALLGVVPVANGGLNNNATPSVDGQIPIWNAAQSKYVPSDPIVSGPTAVGAAPTTNPVYVAGLDGTNIRFFKFFDIDSGAGTDYNLGISLRKAASGGSVELGTATDPMRTDPTGTTIQPISGTITANAGTGTFTVGGTVTSNAGTGTFNNQQSNVTEDYDTGAGTQTMTKFGIALPASGGSVAGGTATNPVRTDPTGTTIQPVSGTVTANQGTPTNWAVNAAQVAGTATSVNAGNVDAGTIRVAPARNADVCNPVDASQVAVSVAASGSTELVALTAGQTIYICDVVLIAGGTVNMKLLYGTGAACATGPTDMTGATQLTAQTGWSNSPEGRLKTAAANALCINLSAAINVQGFITYRKAATF